MQNALLIPRPGPRFGPYPESRQQTDPWPSFHAELLRARLRSVSAPHAKDKERFLEAFHAMRGRLHGCDIEFIRASARRLRGRLSMSGMTRELVVEAFSLIDACMHTHLGLRLHDSQLLAGWLMLDRRLVEMQTGEGKTLAVALAAACGALAGIPVHVITANDYLAGRDAEILAPVFRSLELTVGTVTAATEGAQRPHIYLSDITYCTAKEVVFDYLRDRLATTHAGRGKTEAPQRKLRGTCMAIVDEADSVLIDEARMPLVLSGQDDNADLFAFYRQAMFLAAQLKEDKHYCLNHVQRTAVLTEAGESHAEALATRVGGVWLGRRRREEVLRLALAARHLFLKDKHYLVREQQVVIIDETTGRAAPGRIWSRGLHQLIELKENCPLTGQQQTIAQTTFQRFFSRYLRLSGISGTLLESRHELLAIYGLPVVQVPLQSPCRRRMLPSRVFADQHVLWRHVVARVLVLRTTGQPVLIGTDSLEDSETLSTLLRQAGVPHHVLNARNDAEEARIVAAAGKTAAVTVSTNMAGRGTDIRIAPEVAALGGLHVIACQTNDSSRIDRQLYGRCARQGEPGSVEHFYCITRGFEPLPVTEHLKTLLAARCGEDGQLPRQLAWLASVARRMRAHYRRREQWFQYVQDKQIDRQTAFAGQRE
jgi:preprotein translocase subunit SecA